MKATSKFHWRIADAQDASWIYQMRCDDEIRLNIHTVDRFTRKQCEDWLINLSNTSQRLVIMDNGDRPVGLFRIDNIDYQNQNCCFGLDILKEHRGQGHAIPIWQMMMDEWFNNRNMHMIWLEVLSTNPRATHIYEKLGFKHDGKFRDAVFRQGQWIDSIFMSIKHKEYFEKRYDEVGSELLQTK